MRGCTATAWTNSPRRTSAHSCIAFKDVGGTGKKQLGFGEVDLKAATRYAAEDADVTLRLWRRFKPRLAA